MLESAASSVPVRAGWFARRRELRSAVRRVYAASLAGPTRLSRAAEGIAWVISGLAYAISYASLYSLAYAHGFRGPLNWESIAWPTTVDLASLATGILALDQAHRGESARLAWVISAVAASIMVAGNVLAAGLDPVAIGMHAWAPVIALSCWFLLVHVRRSNSRASALVQGAEVRTPDSQPEREPDGANDSHDDDPGGSQPPSAPRMRTGRPTLDPRVLRVARAGGDWKEVARVTGMTEHAAKRALTAARKRLRPNGALSGAAA